MAQGILFRYTQVRAIRLDNHIVRVSSYALKVENIVIITIK